MEYGKSNRFPKPDSDFMGAIFVCNNLTKKESFKRKLFGLPSVHSDLVKQIKTGMILFLFEPDERKLHGIFQATSDGAMNIVPRAFSISNKRFPAQVRFERLCACKPLSENEFREAIEENYFTAIKFSFALLGPQVCRLIWLFSSRSYLLYDQLPKGLQSEFMKIFENSSLARTKVIGNENLPKFDAAGYSMDNNIQSTRNSFLLGPSKNHLKKYNNHEQNDITLQNYELRGQPEFYPTFYHSAKLQQQNQMLSTSRYDLSRDVIPVIPSTRRSYSSSRFLCKPPPPVALGSDLLEQKLTFSKGSSLDAQTPHIRNQSYTSVSQIEIKNHPLSNNSGIALSKSSCLSDTSQLLHAPEGNVTFHDSYSLSNNKFLCSSQDMEYDSWNIQDWSSGPDYIPNSKGETSVNGYIPVLEVDFAYAKEAYDLPSRKENPPLTSQYDYHSGFTSDINNTSNCSFDFSYNDKKSASYLNSFPKSNSFQKRCNVFQRLSRPPKINKEKIKKYPYALDRMEAFSHQRSQGIKVCGKLGNLASLESDAPLDNIAELRSFEKDSLVEIKPQVQVLDDGNGFSIPNFKRRSAVKQPTTGASDFTPPVDKCKKRKLIRPSFSEEDNSFPVREDCQNLNLPHTVHKGLDDHNILCTVSHPGTTEELPISKESNAPTEGVGSVGHLGPLSTILEDNAGLSNTDSLTVNIHCSQQILDSESKKINSYCLMGDENVDGNPKENSQPLTMDFIPLSVEEEHKAINTAKNCMDSDMKHVVVKMDAPDFPLGIRCKTTSPDLVCEDNKITSDGFGFA
ncbi:uncharacterized protein LOC110103739 [Dendrobium catenatum]|uniref:B2 protein n=1 Tax=Dendrobium catenatum TaxID=906689 RepID=A0A2I0WMA6_9ASPA|nr:uncharacterized protein LOC110103739 [Dendrobium catenatum]PKU76795.1 B2 protein [Dendrobium catenatum]